MTTFDSILPIVEGKLYAYGLTVLRYPDAPISSVYQEVVATTGDVTSPQERWAVQHANDLRDAAVIERVVRTLPQDERDLIRLRYIERWPWNKVADKLHVSRSSVYRIRDRVVVLIAREFGFLSQTEKVETL